MEFPVLADMMLLIISDCNPYARALKCSCVPQKQHEKRQAAPATHLGWLSFSFNKKNTWVRLEGGTGEGKEWQLPAGDSPSWQMALCLFWPVGNLGEATFGAWTPSLLQHQHKYEENLLPEELISST